MSARSTSPPVEASRQRLRVNPSRILGAATTTGLVLLIAAAPWPIGSVQPWAFWLIVVLAWTLLAIRGLALISGSDARVSLPAPVGVAAVLLLAVLVWSALQASIAAPAGWAHPIWAELPADLPVSFPTVSLDPDRTIEAVCRLSAYLAIGVLAYLAARSARRARRLLWAFLVVAALQAGLGLLREAAGIRELFGYALNLGRASGSFVNPNHFAAYVNLAVVAAAVLLLDALRAEADAPRLATALARAARAMLERQVGLTLLLALLLMASLASGSRGGFVSLVLASVILLLVRFGRGTLLLAVLGLLVALGAALLFTAGVPTLERLDELLPASELEPGAGGRLAGFALAIEAWRQRPWSGHGLGAWPAVFHTLRDERFPLVQFDYVHNTWLELLLELGAPAFAALLVAFALLLFLCYRAAVQAREPLPAIGSGAAVLLGLHGLVDFPAQIPAVAASFAMIFGLAVGRAAVWFANRDRSRRSHRAAGSEDEL
ncbi:MAG: O-antigen ligase family protein [Geminicoccaceae bacterium]|nr:O-antigen ligase family protein [Geminicoccaceae bacterium]